MDDSLFEARLNNHDILINTLAKSQANMDRNFTLLTEILQRVVDQQERHSAEMKAINERLDAQEGQIKVLIEQFVNGFNIQTFREMIDAFNSKFEAVFAELKENDAKFAQNEAKFEQFLQKFAENDAKFEQFLQKFAENDAKFKQIFQKFAENDAKFEQIFQKFAENDAKFEQFLQKFAENDAKFERFFAELERLDQQIAEQNSHIRSLLEIIRKKLEM